MRRRPVGRLILLACLVLLLVGLVVLWFERVPIARHYVDRELARRGVHATYRIGRIGFGTERLDDVVIGDPADPDLTARRVAVRLSWGLHAPRVGLIVARGVRLHGRLVDGKLRLGEVDKLIAGPPSNAPFRLPDQDVDVADAALRLDTQAGRIGIGVEGRGNLADGFRGRMAAVAHRLAVGKCGIVEAAGSWTVSVDRERPHLVGPARIDRFACPNGLRVAGVTLGSDTTLASALDGWTGRGTIAAASLDFGKNGATGIEANLDFDGNQARTTGHVAFAAAGARGAGFAADRIAASGAYDLAPNGGRFGFAGDARTSGLHGGEALIAPLLAALDSARGTPVGPVASAWGAALKRAMVSGVDATATLRIAQAPGGGEMRIARLSAASRGGARLAFGQGRGVAYAWPAGTAQADGDFSLLGGGLPHARFSLGQAGPGQPIRGVGLVAPYEAGGARLALGAIRIAGRPGGATTIRTVATIDGPFSGGGVKGLVVPVAGRVDGHGGFAFGETCTPISFASLREGSLQLGPSKLPLCPARRALLWKAPGGAVQGGASVKGARLAGRLGGSPVTLAAQDMLIGLAGPDFTGSGVALRLGAADRVSRLDIAALSGRFGKDGLSGSYQGLSGKIAAVPLLAGEGRGQWRFARGALGLSGSLTLADEQAPPRFYPLASDDFRLALADNRIQAEGWLKEPKTGTRILQARIDHDLGSGAGRALLDVPGIVFDEHLQPEQLTRLTEGVVALVRGTVKGEGEIGWNDKGTTSSGTFSTENTNLAASFGPVEGLTATIHFTDLLGLVSAPGQVAEVKAVHTGIDAFDGRIRYQLLPDLRVKVEGATWPFAGGVLTLDETILDFSKPSPKSLTFHVAGMDGARFIEQMQFSNISGTGTFDGMVPMIFDESGGRIVDGRLAARPGGGTLSYIGELTDKQLGTYGKLAFDALKSLRYDRLVIDLNGALDGEFVAAIQLNGIARDPSIAKAPSGGISGLVVGRVLGQLAKIPFKFNINVRGPFRAVIGTARSLQDPTDLIQSVLPEMLQGKPTTTVEDKDVQPQESGSVR
ncbi:MAG TPA: YdbH domain-containing protein [Allosphingosinicella sp.]|nr:YdbH domain-containing protein [Allosphingosinicella sp.]